MVPHTSSRKEEYEHSEFTECPVAVLSMNDLGIVSVGYFKDGGESMSDPWSEMRL